MGDVSGVVLDLKAISDAKRGNELEPMLERGLQFHACQVHSETFVNAETQ